MKTPIIKFLSDRDTLNLTKNLSINLSKNQSPFCPPDGFSFSILSMDRDAPHDGEMHPDGDEIIYVISGKIEVTLELDKEELFEVVVGTGIVIPKGIWHKIHVIEAAQLVTVVPGPSFEFRTIK
jgi:quercetin dioxygenase-like cupin family protein